MNIRGVIILVAMPQKSKVPKNVLFLHELKPVFGVLFFKMPSFKDIVRYFHEIYCKLATKILNFQ